LRHFSGDPIFNMAVDEWLAWRASLEPGAVYLRLYTWRVGAITIGLNQKEELALDFSKLSDTPAIRRVTGGRAVYHDPAELTYAVAINTRCLSSASLAGSLPETSAAIAKALTCFLSRLGIESQYVRHSTRQSHRPSFHHTAPCFASVSRHEVVTGSGKIIASAQRRIKTTILQHGAIKLHGITYHPALNGQMHCNFRASNLKPITKERFDMMASLFVLEMKAFFGIAIEERQLGKTENEQVRYRSSFLKKNPLIKRNFFEHWLPLGSLFSRF